MIDSTVGGFWRGACSFLVSFTSFFDLREGPDIFSVSGVWVQVGATSVVMFWIYLNCARWSVWIMVSAIPCRWALASHHFLCICTQAFPFFCFSPNRLKPARIITSAVVLVVWLVINESLDQRNLKKNVGRQSLLIQVWGALDRFPGEQRNQIQPIQRRRWTALLGIVIFLRFWRNALMRFKLAFFALPELVDTQVFS